MSKPRILFEAGPMMDTHRTGVGYYVGHLFENLAIYYGEQFEMTGYYFDFLSHNHKQTPAIPNIKFQNISLVPGKILSVCRRLNFQPYLELFTQKNTDVVLFTNYVSLPMLRRKPTALIVYDLSFLDCPEFAQPVNLDYLKRFSLPSIQRADLIITISEFTKQRLLHYFPDLKAKVIITPIPPVEKTIRRVSLPARLTDLGIAENKYLLFVSTLEPRKNLENLVNAYAALPLELRNEYSLVLAGGKGWRDEAIIETITKLQKDGCKIIRPGYISDEEKEALYSNASAFVMPSHYEGFGMPLLEAMQYGIPVVCSDIGVFHEVAGPAAAYFDKDDTNSIASVLKDVLTNPSLRQQLLTEAPKRLSSYSWKNNAYIVANALQDLAA